VKVSSTNPEKLRLEPTDHGVRDMRKEFTLRFLLSDGRTLDVVSDRDDSDVRTAVLDYTKADRIEGVALLPAQQELFA
jgi:hypothetical protein